MEEDYSKEIRGNFDYGMSKEDAARALRLRKARMEAQLQYEEARHVDAVNAGTEQQRKNHEKAIRERNKETVDQVSNQMNINVASDYLWRGRAEHMRCWTCMWYVQKLGNIGRCRRHAPTLNGYPVVMSSDWCGDHKINEKA